MRFLHLLLFLILLSCSTRKAEEKRRLVWEQWKGRNIVEIESHPYLKNIPIKKKIKHDDGTETWIYRDQTRFQTEAYCDSLGGCMGMPIYSCDNAFTIDRDGTILGMEQQGSCPGPKVIEPTKH